MFSSFSAGILGRHGRMQILSVCLQRLIYAPRVGPDLRPPAQRWAGGIYGPTTIRGGSPFQASYHHCCRAPARPLRHPVSVSWVRVWAAVADQDGKHRLAWADTTLSVKRCRCRRQRAIRVRHPFPYQGQGQARGASGVSPPDAMLPATHHAFEKAYRCKQFVPGNVLDGAPLPLESRRRRSR